MSDKLDQNISLWDADIPINTATLGRLVPLKTTLETRARDSLLSVYVTSVPAKSASTVLNLIRKLVPEDGGYDLQHIRRFAKASDVPEHVRSSILEEISRIEPQVETGFSPDLFLIVGATNFISMGALHDALSTILTPLVICSVQIPLLAPTSQEQAVSWSARYWPTVYKKSNPFGPHPSIISRAEEVLQEDTWRYMDLAVQAAHHSDVTGIGEKIGAVVVERKGGVARPLAVAGDARWMNWPRKGSGNTTAHAALRVIAMMSEGLREKEEGKVATSLDKSPKLKTIFRDQPLGTIEEENYKPTEWEDGYLCHDLELYLTHEPCVMCSMAIVHSRFGRVIFQHRMVKTGGFCADNELGHGLFWRKELNWSLLAWQWVNDNVKDAVDLQSQLDLHA